MSPIRFSRDAAIVVGLAGTAMPFAMSRRAEAERWLRILRLYGEAGQALQALGIPEGPLESTPEELPTQDLQTRREIADNSVQAVADHSVRLATLRGAPMLGTLDILFAVLAVYGSDFDRALYVRGSSREDLLTALAASYRRPAHS